MAIVESVLYESNVVDGDELAKKLTENKTGKNKGKNISEFKKDLKKSIEQTEIEAEIKKQQLKEAEKAHLQQKKDELENDETHKEVA